MKDRTLDSAAEGNSRHADTRNRPETISLYNPVYADDVIALRETPVAIRDRKSQAKPTLDSLRKTILKLRSSLMLNNKKDKTSAGDDRVIIATLRLSWSYRRDRISFRTVQSVGRLERRVSDVRFWKT